MSTREGEPDATALRGTEATAVRAMDATAVGAADATVARLPQTPAATPASGLPAGNPDRTLTATAAGDPPPSALTHPDTTVVVPRSPRHVPAGALVPGARLRDRYVLDALIGQGAMGQVWRAKDLLGEEAQDRNPFVAVKVLISDVESQDGAFVALHREAARAQKLAHPNIITVYVFDRDDRSGRAFIAMELLEGQPLDRMIREAGFEGLPRAKAMPIIRGMAEGLAYAHRQGLVHSDFKPANVFLTREGVPKILDFGIARAVQSLDGAARTAALDGSGFQGYTPVYAAPEVLAGSIEPSTADDVFALALVAYELLTGRHPFDRRPALEAESEGMQPPPLRGLPRREARALARALSFRRSGRPADAGAFLRQLQGVPLIQKVLLSLVAVLILAAGGIWYRSHVDSLPAQPLEQLPADVQAAFRASVQQGNESLAYMASTKDITASADAAHYFAAAYQLHEKDPLAVKGLNAAADRAIDWYSRMPDRTLARKELKKFQDLSDYYQNYAPLVRAIRAAGGE